MSGNATKTMLRSREKISCASASSARLRPARGRAGGGEDIEGLPSRASTTVRGLTYSCTRDDVQRMYESARPIELWLHWTHGHATPRDGRDPDRGRAQRAGQPDPAQHR